VTRVAAEIRPENAPIDERTGQLADRWKKHTSLMTVGLESGQVTLDPGQIYTATYNLFVGPKHRPLLLAAGNQLERADYYSSWFWMRGLCIVLTKMLNVFHAVVGNYGWAILLLTVVIRLMLYPLTHRQMVIMAKTQQEMARVKPFIDEVKEKYKDEPQRMQREMMAVYKEHGVNPFAGLKGCLPLVFQMPIFIALFIVLRSSIELRGAQWLWIKDLSGPDALFPIPGLEELPLVGTFLGNSFNLLPILMAVTQWLTMKLSPTRIDDPAQRTMMSLMPIGLSVFMYRAPSGLMIYWIAGNLWQMGHQHLTTKWVQHHTEEKPASESPEPPKADHKSKHGKMAKGESATSRAKAKLAERRRDATKARQRAVSESSSLPRWVRRGGG
jgi:YidC/Oxa1 family membrane protein insertase